MWVYETMQVTLLTVQDGIHEGRFSCAGGWKHAYMSQADDASQETHLHIQLSWLSARPGFASCALHEL